MWPLYQQVSSCMSLSPQGTSSHLDHPENCSPQLLVTESLETTEDSATSFTMTLLPKVPVELREVAKTQSKDARQTEPT